jgi:insulysin
MLYLRPNRSDTDNTKKMEFNQSESDTRKYQYLELDNKMKIVLVSDPEATASAASMNVAVGSTSDPSDCLGLAHFLEHMLFMGTEKYPEESYYATFLKENAGSSNAHTNLDDTCFYFDVANEKLEVMLDIFA